MPSYLGQIPRTTRINDDGTKTKGTPLNDAELQAQYDAIEQRTFSGNHPNVAMNSLLDNVMAGIPFDFGGDPNMAASNIAYEVGATYDKLAPGSRPLSLKSEHVLYGRYKLEAVLNTSDVAYTTTLGIFNLTDAPNVALAEITTTVTTGELKQSADLVFPVPTGAAKVYGVKIKTSNAAGFAKAWGIRLIRVE